MSARLEFAVKTINALRALGGRNHRKVLRIGILGFESLLLLCSTSTAATYYIDYARGSDSNNGISTNSAWQYCPGMPAFAGAYAHSVGDRFVFRGGITWPSNALNKNGYGFSPSAGGASGTYDYYGTNPVWYGGSSWSPPVFDGGNLAYTNSVTLSGISYYQLRYIIVEGLRIQNIGLYGRGISFNDCDNIIVRNCYLTPGSVNGVDVLINTNTAGNFQIYGNYVENTVRSIYAAGTTFNVCSKLIIHDNVFGSSLFSGDYGSYHADGIYVKGFSPNSTVPHQYGWSWTNVYIYNNRFFGNWPIASAQIYSDGGLSGTYIYNNVLSLDTTNQYTANAWQITPGLMTFLACNWMRIYNNTISSDASTQMNNGALSGITAYHYSSNIEIKNNILSQPYIGININDPTATNILIDYNLYRQRSPGLNALLMTASGSFSTLAAARAAGYEAHGVVANPWYVHPPEGTIGGADFHLRSVSPAVGAGTNLTSLFTADLEGNPRPSNGPWDMGAYQLSTNRPSPPHLAPAR